MRKDEIVNQILDPRLKNLGDVGAALVAAAKAWEYDPRPKKVA